MQDVGCPRRVWPVAGLRMFQEQNSGAQRRRVLSSTSDIQQSGVVVVLLHPFTYFITSIPICRPERSLHLSTDRTPTNQLPLEARSIVYCAFPLAFRRSWRYPVR